MATAKGDQDKGAEQDKSADAVEAVEAPKVGELAESTSRPDVPVARAIDYGPGEHKPNGDEG